MDGHGLSLLLHRRATWFHGKCPKCGEAHGMHGPLGAGGEAGERGLRGRSARARQGQPASQRGPSSCAGRMVGGSVWAGVLAYRRLRDCIPTARRFICPTYDGLLGLKPKRGRLVGGDAGSRAVGGGGGGAIRSRLPPLARTRAEVGSWGGGAALGRRAKLGWAWLSASRNCRLSSLLFA